MKFALPLLALAASAVSGIPITAPEPQYAVPAELDPHEALVTPEAVEAINHAGLGWTATTDSPFANTPRAAIRKMLGFKLDALARESLPLERDIGSADASIPGHFYMNETWPGSQFPVRNQQQCGSCWAFGAAESFASRVFIASNGTHANPLSVEQLVDCNLLGLEGCSGGDPATASAYISLKGLVSEACYPYTAGNGKGGHCQHSCTNTTAPNTWSPIKGKLSTIKWSLGEKAMQERIMAGGGIEVCFSVYSDFMAYAGGVYTKSSSATYEGGHCVMAEGWGVQNDTPYWLVRNSWGTSWGIDGYFLIRRGTDECGIEREAFSIDPQF